MAPQIEFDLSYTDMGNRERLVNKYGDQIRYCPENRKWYIWDDKRWEMDNRNTIVEYAVSTVKAIMSEIDIAEEVERPKIAKHCKDSKSSIAIRNMIDLAKSVDQLVVPLSKWDADNLKINVLNGTLDIRTLKLMPHDKGDFITRLIPHDYDPNAKAPIWEKFMESIMSKDKRMIEFLQLAVGYSITGLTREQCMFVLHGGGSNGKSTFVGILRELSGEYGAQANPTTFMMKSSGTIRNDVARLHNARCVAASETKSGKHLDENLIKAMTGDDIQVSRFLRQEEFEYKPTYKIWLSTNHKPRVEGTDHAIWRRLKLIPFNTIYWDPDKGENGPDNLKMDKLLREKLNNEMNGILAWAAKGANRWLMEGLKLPESVQMASRSYRMEQDPIGIFAHEELVFHNDVVEDVNTIYDKYVDWCNYNRDQPVAKNEFNRLLAERSSDIKRMRMNGSWQWVGVGIASPVSLTTFVPEEE